MASYKKTKRLIRAIISLTLLLSLFYFSYNFFMTLAYPLKYKKLVLKTSKKQKIDKYLILAIIKEESHFDKNSLSKKGAVGLMQLMPETATWISSKKSISFNKKSLIKPEINISLGTQYFRYLKDKYKKVNLALAAYNSGTSILDSWLNDNPDGNLNNFVYPQTRDYVLRVKKSQKTYKKLYKEEDFLR